MEEQVKVLLQLLNDRDCISMPRVAKRLRLSVSELLRILAQLGSDEGVGGLGLVEVIEGKPTLMRLTQAGRHWIAANASAQ